MKHVVIIPAHNESATIGNLLESLVKQTCKLTRVIVVNDQSTDDTEAIIRKYAAQYDQVNLVNNPVKTNRDVGAKVVAVFNVGLSSIDPADYDLISKLDADLELPRDYFERVQNAFASDPEIGIAGGVCVIKSGDRWVNEGISDLDHVRGPIKTYRIAAFGDMGGLKPILGWDVVDEYILRYHGWKVFVDPSLEVKHFRPTNTEGKWLNLALRSGEAMYRMRYGLFLAFTSAMKRGLKRKPKVISGFVTLFGFIAAFFRGAKPVVSKQVGKFIRDYRISRIKGKIGAG